MRLKGGRGGGLKKGDNVPARVYTVTIVLTISADFCWCLLENGYRSRDNRTTRRRGECDKDRRTKQRQKRQRRKHDSPMTFAFRLRRNGVKPRADQ